VAKVPGANPPIHPTIIASIKYSRGNHVHVRPLAAPCDWVSAYPPDIQTRELSATCLEGYIDLSGTSSFVASESSADTQIGTTTRLERLLERVGPHPTWDSKPRLVSDPGMSWCHSNFEVNQTFPRWIINFLVQPVQTCAVEEMIISSSGKNTVQQLTMEERKSSVIVPIVATALSNSRTFMRVVVLKLLARQMFQLLVERLSHLPNRRIFYMSFLQTSSLEVDQMWAFQRLYVECMNTDDILVAQPEHILSFKLMGIECMCYTKSSPDRNVANALMEAQR